MYGQDAESSSDVMAAGTTVGPKQVRMNQI